MPNTENSNANGAPSLGLRANQLTVFQHPARFRVVVAGRRFGKSQLSLIEMLTAAKKPKSRIWYVGPNFDQAKRILWSRLKAISKPIWGARPTETDLTVTLENRSTISLRGADRADSIRGNGLDFVVLDEFASMDPEAWPKVLRPALSDRQGRALFLGTPQGAGDHFFELFEKAKTLPDWAVFQFTTSQGGNVAHSEITSAASDLDAESFRQEYEAVFTGAGAHRVYTAFDKTLNLQSVDFDPRLPLIWSIDFNVNPMCSVLMQRLSDSVYVVDELILKPEANTQLACDAFHARTRAFNVHCLNVEIYGDVSGNQRRTSAAETDWSIIRSFFRQRTNTYHMNVRTNSVNPAVRDRVNCVNSRLRSADGEPHVFIDPRCKELIRDFEQVTWQLDRSGRVTTEIDKSDRFRTHSSDAFGYYVAQAFPLRPSIGPKSSGSLL